MRSFIMGILVAVGLAFLFMQSTTLRVHMVEERPRISFDESTRPQRTTIFRTGNRGHGDRSFQELKVTGVPKLNRDDAFDDALKKAATAIEDHFNLRTSLHPEDVKQLVREPVEKPVNVDGIETKQFELTLHMDHAFVEQLAHIEREARMSNRMQILARSLMVVVAGLFAVAGYVRLDEWSKGYYSGLLKAVALIAVVGIGFAAWMK